MTQQTNIADIVTPLKWETHIGDGNYDHALVEYLPTMNLFADNDKWSVSWGDFRFAQGGCGNVLVGMRRAEAAYKKLILAYIDLTKLQPQPAPFWKPIEQCPKLEGSYYDLWVMEPIYHGDGIVKDHYYRLQDCYFYDGEWYYLGQYRQKIGGAILPIAFAEIPACEVQP
ncbi:hypothetical protein [Bartonella sp. LJL80]